MEGVVDDDEKGQRGRNQKKDDGRRGTWLAQLVELATLDFRVVSLGPTLEVEITLKKKKRMEGSSRNLSLKKTHG